MLNHSEFSETKGLGDKLLFQIKLKRAKCSSIPKMVEINKIKGRGMQFSGRLERPDEVICGLKAYYANNYAFDNYLYWLEGDPAVYIKCASIKMDIPYPSCDMVWDYSEAISYNVSFSKKYLSKWKLVLEKSQ